MGLELPAIAKRLKALALPEVDAVVGIASGGVVPASLVAYQLERPLRLVTVAYRGPDHRPRYSEPQLTQLPQLDAGWRRLLVVDDVSVSGKTLAVVTAALAGKELITLVLRGQADIVTFPEIVQCVAWPWQFPAVAAAGRGHG